MPNLEGIITTASAVAANLQQSSIGSFLGRTIFVNPTLPVALAVACVVAFIFYKIYTYNAHPQNKIQNEVTPIPYTAKEVEDLQSELAATKSKLELLSKTDKNDTVNQQLTNRIDTLTNELTKVKESLETQIKETKEIQKKSKKEKRTIQGKLEAQILKTKEVKRKLKAQTTKLEEAEKKNNVHESKINERKEIAEKVGIYLEKALKLKVEIDKFVKSLDIRQQVGVNPAYLQFQKTVESLQLLNKKLEKDDLCKIRYLLEAARVVLFQSRNTILNYSGNAEKILSENTQLNELIQFFSKETSKLPAALHAYNEIVKSECSVAADLKKGLNFIKQLTDLYYYFNPLPGEEDPNIETRKKDKYTFEKIVKQYTIAQELSQELSLKFMSLVHSKDNLSQKEIATQLNEIYFSDLFNQYTTAFTACAHLHQAIGDINLSDILERAIKFKVDITPEVLNIRLKDLNDKLEKIMPVTFQRMTRIADLADSFKKHLSNEDSILLDKGANHVRKMVADFDKELKGTVVTCKIAFPTEANFDQILQTETAFSAELKKMIDSTDQLLQLDCFKFLNEWAAKNPLLSWTPEQNQLKQENDKLKVIKEKFTTAHKLSCQLIAEIEKANSLTTEGAKIKKLKAIYQSNDYMKALAECSKPMYENQGIDLSETIRLINKSCVNVVINDETKQEIELLKSSAVKRKGAHGLMEKSLDKYLLENNVEIEEQPADSENKKETVAASLLKKLPPMPSLWRKKENSPEPKSPQAVATPEAASNVEVVEVSSN